MISDKSLKIRAQSVLEKADLFAMTNYATKKDHSLKSQPIVSASWPENSEDVCSDKFWPAGGFYKD